MDSSLLERPKKELELVMAWIVLGLFIPPSRVVAICLVIERPSMMNICEAVLKNGAQRVLVAMQTKRIDWR